ncbi:MAG: hypothetical protein QXS14_04190 [Desulfurococcaceae archaeon]
MIKPLSKPPRIKVLEAAGAVGDNRIKVLSSTSAAVGSSLGDREYKVVLIEESMGMYRAYSNDNGTLHRGYVGYPILAFMIVKNILPVDNDVIRAMTGIPWKELNERYQKYAIVENIVISRAERLGVPRSVIDDYINVVFKKLGLMKIYFDESLARL